MKKLKLYLAAFTLICLTIPALQSCMNDDNSNLRSYLTIGTLNIIEGREYYFDLDDGDKMYPGDTTHVHNYTLIDGQRAFIHFFPLEEDIPGYEYNAQIVEIENILTKPIIPLTTATADSIGNDRINVINLWITNNFLNIEYQFFHSNNEDKKHMLNLVINETPDAPSSEPDYINLEFRHNSYGDVQRKLFQGVVSFKLDEIAGQLNKKGLKILVNSIYDGKRTYTVEFNKGSSNT
ncbi:NigD-like protein [Bacteroides sp. UBA939]|uniref:NigD-like protein n=1 Tax=Bacteroides sp. UBA939 TaxID=1946092 RepID=UPI0025BBF0C7|nr:NigD-like protein [Bacteroides sp. UBA939]